MSIRSKRTFWREQSPDIECFRDKRSRFSSDEEEDRRSSKMSPNGLRSPSFGSQHNKPAELFRKDLISAMKLADSDPLQPEEYFEIADPWRQEWEKGVQVPVNPTSIPEISVRILREKPKSGDFKIPRNPRKLLHATQDENYRQSVHELTGMQQLAEQVVRYDLDDIDVCWLTKVNEEREEMGDALIDEWIMERIIEELENQCHDTMQKTIKTEEGLGIEYDEDVTCDVCHSPDSEENNEMVFCDGCDICVHQACYGIQAIPEGSWLCRPCSLGVKPVCILCPNANGAMKSTRSGTKWAHVSCSLWIPEVSIGCVERMEPITKISQIPPSRWALVCCLCKERVGACIQCSVKTCKTAFHVTCAFNNNLEMRTILDESDVESGVKLKAYCPKHSKKRERSQADSELESPRKEIVNSRKELSVEEKANMRASRLTQLDEEFYMLVNVRDVSIKFNIDYDIVDLVCVYWKLKRKANYDRPLLTPKRDEASLLERQQEDSLAARMKMFVHLRQDLERVRNLCYMVSRREKMKRHYYRVKESIFQAQVELLTSDKQPMTSREVNKILAKYEDDSIYNVFLMQDHDPDTTVLSDWGISRVGYEDFIKRHLSFNAVESKHQADYCSPQRTPISLKGCVRKKARQSPSSENSKQERTPKYDIKKLIPHKNKENAKSDDDESQVSGDNETAENLVPKRQPTKKMKRTMGPCRNILKDRKCSLLTTPNKTNSGRKSKLKSILKVHKLKFEKKALKKKLSDKFNHNQHLSQSYPKFKMINYPVSDVRVDKVEGNENKDKSNVLLDVSVHQNKGSPSLSLKRKRRFSHHKIKQESSQQTDDFPSQDSDDDELARYTVTPLKPSGHISDRIKAELHGLLEKSKLLVPEKLGENLQDKLLQSKKIQCFMNGLRKNCQPLAYNSSYWRFAKMTQKHIQDYLADDCSALENQENGTASSVFDRLSSGLYNKYVHDDWYEGHNAGDYKAQKYVPTSHSKQTRPMGDERQQQQQQQQQTHLNNSDHSKACPRLSLERRVRRKLSHDLDACRVNNPLISSTPLEEKLSETQTDIVSSNTSSSNNNNNNNNNNSNTDTFKTGPTTTHLHEGPPDDKNSENIDHTVYVDSFRRLSAIPRRITRSLTTEWNGDDGCDNNNNKSSTSSKQFHKLKPADVSRSYCSLSSTS